MKAEQRTISSRKRGKANPKRICNDCGEKIFNKVRNALYCKECGDMRYFVYKRLNNLKYCFKSKFPNNKVTVRFKIVKRENARPTKPG